MDLERPDALWFVKGGDEYMIAEENASLFGFRGGASSIFFNIDSIKEILVQQTNGTEISILVAGDGSFETPLCIMYSTEDIFIEANLGLEKRIEKFTKENQISLSFIQARSHRDLSKYFRITYSCGNKIYENEVKLCNNKT